MTTRKLSIKPIKLPPRLAKQISRYGKPWSELNKSEKFRSRSKARRRGRPVNAYIKDPESPSCFYSLDEGTCGICLQTIDDYTSDVTWDDGIQLMLQAARKEKIDGGGYRSRGAILYAMAVLKKTQFYMRHDINCCQPAYQMINLEFGGDLAFFPFPPVVWFLVTYGAEANKNETDIATANQISALIYKSFNDPRIDDLKNWPAPLKNAIKKLEKKYNYKDWFKTTKSENRGSTKYLETSADPNINYNIDESLEYDNLVRSNEIPF